MDDDIFPTLHAANKNTKALFGSLATQTKVLRETLTAAEAVVADLLNTEQHVFDLQQRLAEANQRIGQLEDMVREHQNNRPTPRFDGLVKENIQLIAENKRLTEQLNKAKTALS